MMHLLKNIGSIFRRPLPQESLPSPSLDSGSDRGTIKGYRPRRTTRAGQSAERDLTHIRTQDLYVNDPTARSSVDSITTNAIGTGLMPQPRIPFKRLGITKEQALDVKEQMEWIWAEWCTQAHIAGTMHFEDIQFAGLSSILRMGEQVHVPVMEEPDAFNGRTFSLAIQPLSPQRLNTPSDLLNDPSIRDGVHLNDYGRPLGYWLAAPNPTAFFSSMSFVHTALTSGDYRYIPARLAHRPAIFHIFRHTSEEQVRGISCLSTAVKLFRNMSDAIDHELLAQVLAASFPVFIGMQKDKSALPDAIMEQYNLADPSSGESSRSHYQEVEAGTIIYGEDGEIPHILESKRPSQNFTSFVELVTRSIGASVGLPYEVILKDFSKTNYSSARAALNEAWKVFKLYRDWYARLYCHPVWEMVQEEAYLRGRLQLPASAPGFYEARFLWCNAYWYGPSRGYVDPVKEIQANILAIGNRLMTRTEHWAQQGEDFADAMDQIEAEDIRLAAMPNATPTVTAVSKANKSTKETPEDNEDEPDSENQEDNEEKNAKKKGDDNAND